MRPLAEEHLPTVDVILFAENEDSPRLIKVPYVDHGYMHVLQTQAWYPGGYSPRRITLTLGKNSKPTYFVYYNHAPFDCNTSRSGLNRYAQLVSGGKVSSWRGTVLGVRAAPSHPAVGSSERFSHAVLEEDLPRILDCLKDQSKSRAQVRDITSHTDSVSCLLMCLHFQSALKRDASDRSERPAFNPVTSVISVTFAVLLLLLMRLSKLVIILLPYLETASSVSGAAAGSCFVFAAVMFPSLYMVRDPRQVRRMFVYVLVLGIVLRFIAVASVKIAGFLSSAVPYLELAYYVLGVAALLCFVFSLVAYLVSLVVFIVHLSLFQLRRLVRTCLGILW